MFIKPLPNFGEGFFYGIIDNCYQFGILIKSAVLTITVVKWSGRHLTPAVRDIEERSRPHRRSRGGSTSSPRKASVLERNGTTN
jgi:hypothetical protein